MNPEATAKLFVALQDLTVDTTRRSNEPVFRVSIAAIQMAEAGNASIRHEVHVHRGPGFELFGGWPALTRWLDDGDHEVQWAPLEGCPWPQTTGAIRVWNWREYEGCEAKLQLGTGGVLPCVLRENHITPHLTEDGQEFG